MTMSGAEDPQQAVARARARVLSGRGPGADQAEAARYQRERPTLGPLPAPLERELVHLQTVRIRAGNESDPDEAAMQNQIDRIAETWAAKPADHPRSKAMARIRTLPQPADRRRAGKRPTAALLALALGAASVAVWARRRARRRSPVDSPNEARR